MQSGNRELETGSNQPGFVSESRYCNRDGTVTFNKWPFAVAAIIQPDNLTHGQAFG